MVTTKEIKDALASIAGRFNAELIATPENELEKRWYFKWDDAASVEMFLQI